jgi:hypothetical protein
LALHVMLIDRQNLLAPATTAAFRSIGWGAEAITMDVHEWLRQKAPIAPDVIVANLFLHHFDGEALDNLLAGVALRTRVFIACEPQRSRVSLAGARMLGLAGCNKVTRHDAVASVHAGFSAQELSAKWPAAEQWTVRERASGLFTHCFVAVRGESPAADDAAPTR